MGFYYELFPCTYAILKEVVVNIFAKRYESLVSIILFILTIILLTVGFLLFFPWLICYFLVKTYLQVHQRDKFGGLLSTNTLMAHTKMTITTVYILEHDGSYQQLLVNVKMSCQNLMRLHWRFTSTVRKCCGYYYFLKQQVSIDDVISVIEETCSSKNDLLSYLQKNSHDHLDGGVKLWSVKVFRNPITWNGHHKTCYYPVVITYNHCLADAICLSLFQHEHLLEDVVQKEFENALGKSKRSKGNLMKSNFLHLGPVVLEKSRTLLNNLENPDHDLASFIEEKPKYLGLIRELIIRFECTFTDILIIASAVALIDYMEEKNIFPRNVYVGNTSRILTEDTSALLNGRIFNNETSLDLYTLQNVKCKSILETFLKLKELLGIQRNSSTSQFLYVGNKIMSYLPAEILTRLCRPFCQRFLLGVTNISGVDFARFGGAVVKDSFLFINQFIRLKFIMSIYSYAGRLQVALISEKYLITSKEDLEEVLDKVFKVIDDLSEKCETLWHK